MELETIIGRKSNGKLKKKWKDGVEEILEKNGLGTVGDLSKEES